MTVNYDQILAATLLLTCKVTGKSIDDVILMYEEAGLVDHTYVERNGKVEREYSLTPKGKSLLGDLGEWGQ